MGYSFTPWPNLGRRHCRTTGQILVAWIEAEVILRKRLLLVGKVVETNKYY